MSATPPSGRSEGNTGGDDRPVPDPTTLTTQQLLREMTGLRDLIEAKLNGLTNVVHRDFAKVEMRFDLVEQQRLEQKTDTKSAVDAALIAQKEAVREQTTASERAIAKSEAATSKQLEQLSATFKTEIGGVTTGMSDIKTRVERIENIKQGGQQAYAGIYALAGFILVAITIVGLVLGLK